MTATQLVFPYRGVYVRHVGDDQAVAEPNQVLFFDANEGYRVSHPVPGGDASLTLTISETEIRELAPRTLLRDGAAPAFRPCDTDRHTRTYGSLSVTVLTLADGCLGSLCAERTGSGTPERAQSPDMARTRISGVQLKTHSVLRIEVWYCVRVAGELASGVMIVHVAT